jgi:hypothetical protein
MPRTRYPRYQHARIDGELVNRIIDSPEEEEPAVWKESPADCEMVALETVASGQWPVAGEEHAPAADPVSADVAPQPGILEGVLPPAEVLARREARKAAKAAKKAARKVNTATEPQPEIPTAI